MRGNARNLALFATALVCLLASACHQDAQRSGGTGISICYDSQEQATEKNAVSQLLQAQLAAHSFAIRLEPLTTAMFGERVAKGSFDAVYALWYLDYNDPEGFLTDFSSNGSLRISRYQNSEYDRLYKQGLEAATENEQTGLWHQAVALLDRDLPWIPLYSNTEVFVVNPRASGFHSNAYQYYDYRDVDLPEIRVTTDVDVQTLDPAQVYDLASKHVVTQAYEGLIGLDESSKIVPALASQWNFSKKKDELTFQLRPNVGFHQAPFLRTGRSVTSADVRASFERVVKSNSPYAFIFDHVRGIADFKAGKSQHLAGFETPDALTFRIQLAGPFPTMLPWLLAPAAYILPAEIPTNYNFAQGSAGTGPFVLKSWDGSVATLTAHPGYWQTKARGVQTPKAHSLTIRVAKDVSTLLGEFRAGRLDVLNVPLALFPEVLTPNGEVREEWKKYGYREMPLNNLKFIAVNLEHGPLGKDLSLRRRFSESIDRDVIVRQLLRGKGRASRSIIPSGMAGFQ